MIDKLEEMPNDKEFETLSCKTPGSSNPETYVLTQNRFVTYMLLIFSDLSKTQIYKTPYRDSSHHEIEKFMIVKYLEFLKTNDHTENFHIRKPNDETFLFEIEDKNIFNWENF